MDEDEVRRRLVDWFEASEQASYDARQKAERDQDYYDGKQLTQDEFNKLVERGQPPITINLIRRKIDFLLGIEARQRSDPKAYPRTPADREKAEVVTDSLRYVIDATDYHQIRARVWRDMLVPGWGGFQVVAKGARRPDPIAQQFGFEPNPEITIRRTAWDRMFWDPYSSELDFSDARYRGLVIWRDQDDAQAVYPDKADIIQSMISDAKYSETYDDKPKRGWADHNRKRLRIVQIWWKENDQYYWAEYTKNGILAGGESPYVNEYGESADNFVWRSAYVDRDNNRHGVVRDMIDPQDEVNKRRSKSLHLLTVNQVIADEGAVTDKAAAKRELARPDGWLTKNPGLNLEIVKNGDLSAGQMQLLQHATMELEKMGPNESLQGQGSASSGREMQARQQGGMIELGSHLDGLRAMDRDIYRTSWSMCQKFWTAPQYVRVTDNEEAPRFVGLNEPMIDPSTGQMVGMRNQTVDMFMDIVVEEAPDVASIEQEVWADLSQLIPTLANMPPAWAQIVVEASPLPPTRKRRLVELLEQLAQPQQQQPNPMQQQAAQIEMASRVADVEKKRADARHKDAQIGKMRVDAQLDAQELALKAQEQQRPVIYQ